MYDVPDPSWINGPVYRNESPDEIKLSTMLDEAADMAERTANYTTDRMLGMLDECYYWHRTSHHYTLSDDIIIRLEATIAALEGVLD